MVFLKIKSIKVQNFRLLKKTEVLLENKLSLIVGKNNCGKTSFLSVLEKFLKKNDSKFSYDDFNIEIRKEMEIFILNNLETDLKTKYYGEDTADEYIEDWKFDISMEINIGYGEPNENLTNLSEVILDLDVNKSDVFLKFEYQLTLENLIKLIKNYNEFCKKKKLGVEEKNEKIKEFLKEEHAKYFKISKKSIDIEDKDNVKDLIKEKISLEKIINFQCISANRNTSNDIKDKGLSSLSAEYYQKNEESELLKTHIEEFKDKIKDTDIVLNGIYKKLFENILGKIKKFGGMTPNETLIQIMSTLSKKELLRENATVHYNFNDEQMLPENYNGLGYLNLIHMIFQIEIVLGEFKKQYTTPLESPADINLLFIEEPEAHTHPQMQYIFIKNIKDILFGNDSLNLQTIITTHSSHIVSESDFNDIKYFLKSDDSVLSKNLRDLESLYNEVLEYGDEDECGEEYDEGEDEDDCDDKDVKNVKAKINCYKFLKQYLTINRTEIFFADKVIFIEGETEMILLSHFIKMIDEESQSIEGYLPLSSQNISIIATGAHSKIFEKLVDFLGVQLLIITDIDSVKRFTNGKGKTTYKTTKVEEADSTSNSTLTYFFNIKKSDLKLKDCLLKKDCHKPTIFFKKIVGAQYEYEINDKGKIAIAYQTFEKSYYARSFEDSFIHLNRDFLKVNQENFIEGLKNRKKIEDDKIDAFEIAKNCIKKKSAFAIEILLNKKESNNWKIPAYIKEGLIWLQKN